MKFKPKSFRWFVAIVTLIVLSVLLTFAGGIISAVWNIGITPLYIAAGMVIITLIISIIGLVIIYLEMEEKEE